MKILAIRTDKPEAELYFYEDKKQLARHSWHAHKELAESIHVTISTLLKKVGSELEELDAIVCYDSGESFTGLRIGASVANAMSASIGCAVYGTHGSDWLEKGVNMAIVSAPKQYIDPKYEHPANITRPKK